MISAVEKRWMKPYVETSPQQRGRWAARVHRQVSTDVLMSFDTSLSCFGSAVDKHVMNALIRLLPLTCTNGKQCESPEEQRKESSVLQCCGMQLESHTRDKKSGLLKVTTSQFLSPLSLGFSYCLLVVIMTFSPLTLSHTHTEWRHGLAHSNTHT